MRTKHLRKMCIWWLIFPTFLMKMENKTQDERMTSFSLLLSYVSDNHFLCLNLPNMKKQLISHYLISFFMNQKGSKVNTLSWHPYNLLLILYDTLNPLSTSLTCVISAGLNHHFFLKYYSFYILSFAKQAAKSTLQHIGVRYISCTYRMQWFHGRFPGSGGPPIHFIVYLLTSLLLW